MSWVTTVSIIVIILLVLNSIYVVFWLRPKLGKAKTEKPWKRKASPIELFMSILIIFCGLALIVVPKVAPTSQFAKWIAVHGIFKKWIAVHGIFNYAAWCLIGVVALGVIFYLIGLMLKRNDAA
ncbi:MAG: hypothetical protein ACYSTO_10450 [Planctomycetota bacterium]